MYILVESGIFYFLFFVSPFDPRHVPVARLLTAQKLARGCDHRHWKHPRARVVDPPARVRQHGLDVHDEPHHGKLLPPSTPLNLISPSFIGHLPGPDRHPRAPRAFVHRAHRDVHDRPLQPADGLHDRLDAEPPPVGCLTGRLRPAHAPDRDQRPRAPVAARRLAEDDARRRSGRVEEGVRRLLCVCVCRVMFVFPIFCLSFCARPAVPLDILVDLLRKLVVGCTICYHSFRYTILYVTNYATATTYFSGHEFVCFGVWETASE